MITEISEGTEDERRSVTEAIVDAVAAAADRDPLGLPPLWDVVDPEALDALFEPTRGGRPRAGRVTFTYCGYEVTVDDRERVTVSLAPPGDDRAARGGRKTGSGSGSGSG
ncbi:HalOD1 output domain-containing protein [Salinilacihabitans rarus]|uniref:HalOD1 output domain-containing protein n=1 Tax=Salinilacihabitans rarus TaxID=2961596 RepID=UPI0020C8EB50|nr:HalOD1 output domain-containing protein [Salinilacihabitans rarus]